MFESQNIEYKSSWHEEYLEWICGFMVRLFKDRCTEEQLQKFGLKERRIKAVLYAKEKGKITNGEYQVLNSVSKPTATRDLTELAETYKILKNSGLDAGSIYELMI